MSKARAFLGAVLVGATLSLSLAAYSHYTRPDRVLAELHELEPGVFVTAQLRPRDLPELRAAGVRSVIDMRPDGEAKDQPPAKAMAQVATAHGIGFRYEPTPHGPASESLRASFRQAFRDSARPTVLYCRSGSRAAHMWALTEAARSEGLAAGAIIQRVAAAGLSVEDIGSEIETLVAHRRERERGE